MLGERWGSSSVSDVVSDIKNLIATGQLFAPPLEIHVEQLYPDGVYLKSMCLHLCHDCNLRCRYCFAETGDYGTGERSFLSVETGKRAIDYLIEVSGPRRNLDIDFFGGEPLLNWQTVKELVAYCEVEGPAHGKDIRLTITTNALLLDEEKSRYIDQHFKNVVLSLDGRPAVHDRMRPYASGKGSYEQASRNARRFIEIREDREYYIRGTFTRFNLNFSNDVLHLATLGDQLSLEPVVADPGCDYALRMSDLPTIEAEYEKLAQIIASRMADGKGFNFFHFMIDLERGPCLYKRLKGCGVGSEYCAVAPNGDIFPCHQLTGEPEHRMGNVFTGIDLSSSSSTDYPSTFNQAPVEQMSSFYSEQLTSQPDACSSCFSRHFCGGGCYANHLHYGINGEPNELSCAMQRKRLECALWLAAQKKYGSHRDLSFRFPAPESFWRGADLWPV